MRAIEWYLKAADQGDADAQCNLGLLFENGKGVAKDEMSEFELYLKVEEL
jgi:uncharacterized protein